jgi:heme exporter protein D
MSGLGPHAAYILASYALAAVIVGGLVLQAILDYRTQRAALQRLEAAGARRRSGTSPTGPQP